MTRQACIAPYANPKDPICNIQLHELIQSREHETTPRGQTWTLHFVVLGTTSEVEVEQRIQASSIGIYTHFHDHPLREWRITRIGQYVWMVDASYGYKGLAKPSEVSNLVGHFQGINSSTIGGSKQITKAIHTISTSTEAPDFKDAIEFDGKAVKGIDVPTAQTRYREVWKMSLWEIFGQVSPGSDIPGWIKAKDYYGLNDLPLWYRWEKMTGWVHGIDYQVRQKRFVLYEDDYVMPKFRGFEPGSLMFLGATMTQIDDWNFEVTFEFQHEPNEWVLLPDTIDNVFFVDQDDARERGVAPIRAAKQDSGLNEIYKNGWDHLQFYYQLEDISVEDDDGDITLPVPRHYVLQQVVRYCPFGYLGVSTRAILPTNTFEWDACKFDIRGATASCVEAVEMKRRSDNYCLSGDE